MIVGLTKVRAWLNGSDSVNDYVLTQAQVVKALGFSNGQRYRVRRLIDNGEIRSTGKSNAAFA